MSKPVMEIRVSKTGQVQVQTKCIAGTSCTEASRFMEQGLGVVVDETKTAEYYENKPLQQEVHNP